MKTLAVMSLTLLDMVVPKPEVAHTSIKQPPAMAAELLMVYLGGVLMESMSEEVAATMVVA